jgi:hypothetical protein
MNEVDENSRKKKRRDKEEWSEYESYKLLAPYDACYKFKV